jgi:brefeldin A-resistance guanine nucleotide exchange factor 1
VFPSSTLPVETLRSIIDTLLSQIPEDSSPSVITVKPDLPPTSPRPGGMRRKANAPTYDPTLVFVLELATILALKDEESVRELGKDVAGALQSVIRNASNLHFVAISRVVYYLLCLLRESDVSTTISGVVDIAANKYRITISSAPQSFSTHLRHSTKSYWNSVPYH